jgi:hypothetical protein
LVGLLIASSGGEISFAQLSRDDALMYLAPRGGVGAFTPEVRERVLACCSLWDS